MGFSGVKKIMVNEDCVKSFASCLEHSIFEVKALLNTKGIDPGVEDRIRAILDDLSMEWERVYSSGDRSIREIRRMLFSQAKKAESEGNIELAKERWDLYKATQTEG